MQQQINHENRAGKFELTFWGGPPAGLRYRRYHKSLEKAKAEAGRVHNILENRNAHPAIVYDDKGEQIWSSW